jgi:SAM-dependent methyltransferase
VTDNVVEHPRLAEIYDALEADRSDLEVYARIAEELGARRVLDVGCGTGTFALLLAGRGFDVVGVDPSLASLDIARAKPGAYRVRWVHGYATSLPGLQVDLATMTANVAQAIVERPDWEATLRAVHAALRTGGRLVFETRDPAYRAWLGWNREQTYSVTEIDGVGAVESWHEVTDVRGPLVTFRSTTVFASDGEVVTSDSTLRFRDRGEVEADLVAHGYVVDEVRDAPDRPGRELVFIARRPGRGSSAVPDQNLAPFAEPLPRPDDVRPVGCERNCVGLKLSHDEQSTARVRLRQRLLDPFGQAVGLQRQRFSPICEALECRLPDAVEREDDASDPRRVINHPLDERQPVSGSEQRQEARSCEAAPGEGGILDSRSGKLVRVVAEPVLPLRQQPGRAQRHSVCDRVGRCGEIPREDRIDRRCGVRARPPDELDGNAVADARDALRRHALQAPGSEVAQPASRREGETLLELELALSHDQHLDVGDVVRDAARDAPRPYYFVSHDGQRIRDPLRDLTQHDTPRRRRHRPGYVELERKTRRNTLPYSSSPSR